MAKTEVDTFLPVRRKAAIRFQDGEKMDDQYVLDCFLASGSLQSGVGMASLMLGFDEAMILLVKAIFYNYSTTRYHFL